MKRRILAALALAGLEIAAAHAAGNAEAGNADAALNATYKTALSQLDASNQARLREAQRAWIAFRDKECDFRVQGGDGPARADCIAELTRQRTEALGHPLDCPAGETGCASRGRAEPALVACSQSIGKTKSAELVQQCIQVSPATHPPCNAENSCDLILDEIHRGCAMIEKDAPAFCANH